MTQSAWNLDLATRLTHDEGFRVQRYFDSLGIPTIGVGFNLQRDDADAALRKIGVTDVAGVRNGTVALTTSQVAALLEISDAPIVGQCRSLLAPTHFDSMSDARRSAFANFVFNVGVGTATDFHGFRGLLDEGCHRLAHGDPHGAHLSFGAAAQHLLASAYAEQVGARAKRVAAMIATSIYVAIDAYEL